MKKEKITILTNEAKVLCLLYKEKLTRAEIAERTGLDYSSVSYITLRLESLDLIRIAESKKIKKGPVEDVYQITEKGIRELKEALNRVWNYMEILLQLREEQTIAISTS
ncbi:MarR family transcriptional regulator [Saccharolobus shibatae]|uniref:Transcriptional regulator, wHTH n=1 Tax=Saccharolobus shibatae TaxID=2286 RepID=A0A8F5BS21_9CREN|nr:helix-turn-helix domain-containing protein [Saccharolobus shibatae]QXJ30324.1 Transcriptional regulator, wHTH [Saccharolobus shibatae]QXJ30426.1 Transcriptional regulator, wHTH [Saccharolobus shibatae]